jgi:osmotically-inducible protein OsmY
MIPDSEVLAEVLEELRRDPVVSDQSIQTSIRNGVVTLRGQVPSFAAKVAAEDVVSGVVVVRSVRLELEVHDSSTLEVSDAEIADRAAEALARNAFVPAGSIRVQVERGKVTLSGRVVHAFERKAAERALRHIHGVRELSAEVIVSAPGAQ